MSTYLQLQSISNDEELQFKIGSYCYDQCNTFCVITNTSSNECNIIDLSMKQTKTVPSDSLQLITKSKDLREANKLHQQFMKGQSQKAMQLISHKAVKQERDAKYDYVNICNE